MSLYYWTNFSTSQCSNVYGVPRPKPSKWSQLWWKMVRVKWSLPMLLNTLWMFFFFFFFSMWCFLMTFRLQKSRKKGRFDDVWLQKGPGPPMEKGRGGSTARGPRSQGSAPGAGPRAVQTSLTWPFLMAHRKWHNFIYFLYFFFFLDSIVSFVRWRYDLQQYISVRQKVFPDSVFLNIPYTLFTEECSNIRKNNVWFIWQ